MCICLVMVIMMIAHQVTPAPALPSWPQVSPGEPSQGLDDLSQPLDMPIPAPTAAPAAQRWQAPASSLFPCPAPSAVAAGGQATFPVHTASTTAPRSFPGHSYSAGAPASFSSFPGIRTSGQAGLPGAASFEGAILDKMRRAAERERQLAQEAAAAAEPAHGGGSGVG